MIVSVIFQIPQEGNRADRFRRFIEFVLQFDDSWEQSPRPASDCDIDQLKKEANILNSYCDKQDCGMPRKIWPEDYQWFSECFGENGCNFMFMRDYTFFPISKNHLNKNRESLPYLFIGQAWVASPYIAYDYSDESETPPLVWAPTLDGRDCYKASRNLEQLLFSCAFLNYAYYEYEWKAKCMFTDKSLPGCIRGLGDVSDVESAEKDIACTILSEKFASILKQHKFEIAWFSTYTDQFWFNEDTCFIVSRNNDPDSLYNIIEGWIGSHNQKQAENLIHIMAESGFSCSKVYQ